MKAIEIAVYDHYLHQAELWQFSHKVSQTTICDVVWVYMSMLPPSLVCSHQVWTDMPFQAAQQSC